MPQYAIENFGLFPCVPPAGLRNNETVPTTEIDAGGKSWSYLRIFVVLGDTDISFTELKLQHSDVSGGPYEDIPGSVFGTDPDIEGNTSVLPDANDDNLFFVWNLDMRGKKRFIHVAATAGSGAQGVYVAIIAEGFQRDSMPVTVAGHGAESMIQI